MTRDALTIVRPYSKGAWAVGTDSVGDAQNSLTLPPGLYDVEVAASGFSGTGPTLTVAVLEQGYLLSDVNHATVTWQALDDARSKTLTPGAATFVHAFLRGVRITRWWQGDNQVPPVSKANAGVTVTMAGTGPGCTNLQITFWPVGRAPQWNGLP